MPTSFDVGSGPRPPVSLFDRFDQIRGLRVVDDFGSAILCQPQTFRNAIDSDHLARTQHLRAANCELTDRAAAPDRDHTSVLDVAVFGRHVARRKDVAKEEHLVVFQIALNLQRPDIGVWGTRAYCA